MLCNHITFNIPKIFTPRVGHPLPHPHPPRLKSRRCGASLNYFRVGCSESCLHVHVATQVVQIMSIHNIMV